MRWQAFVAQQGGAAFQVLHNQFQGPRRVVRTGDTGERRRPLQLPRRKMLGGCNPGQPGFLWPERPKMMADDLLAHRQRRNRKMHGITEPAQIGRVKMVVVGHPDGRHRIKFQCAVDPKPCRRHWKPWTQRYQVRRTSRTIQPLGKHPRSRQTATRRGRAGPSFWHRL